MMDNISFKFYIFDNLLFYMDIDNINNIFQIIFNSKKGCSEGPARDLTYDIKVFQV